MTVIKNASTVPLNQRAGTIPDVGGALTNWFQPMTFGVVQKTVNGFEVIEDVVEVSFQGVIQPLDGRQLYLKPEGQRAWTWFWLHATTALKLNVDDTVIYLGKQTRVMKRKDYSIYGYVSYDLVQDWTGSGPEPIV